jgi:hypothetical protein
MMFIPKFFKNQIAVLELKHDDGRRDIGSSVWVPVM